MTVKWVASTDLESFVCECKLNIAISDTKKGDIVDTGYACISDTKEGDIVDAGYACIRKYWQPFYIPSLVLYIALLPCQFYLPSHVKRYSNL